jgi:hypothetical protein
MGFQRAVEDDQEFTHSGGEGEFGWFSSGPQSLIKGAQGWVVSSGNQCGHVEAVLPTDFNDEGREGFLRLMQRSRDTRPHAFQ